MAKITLLVTRLAEDKKNVRLHKHLRLYNYYYVFYTVMGKSQIKSQIICINDLNQNLKSKFKSQINFTEM